MWPSALTAEELISRKTGSQSSVSTPRGLGDAGEGEPQGKTGLLAPLV